MRADVFWARARAAEGEEFGAGLVHVDFRGVQEVVLLHVELFGAQESMPHRLLEPVQTVEDREIIV
eukprot:597210-Rhodomonas_salina.3